MSDAVEAGQISDYILPALSFAEKEGTFTNSDRRVQLIRAALQAPGEARADWQIIQELAVRVEQKLEKKNSAGFTFTSPSEIWDEMAELVPDFRGISHKKIERENGVHWPCPSADHPGTPYLFAGTFPEEKAFFIL